MTQAEWLTAAISLGAMIISFLAFRSSERTHRENVLLQEKNASLAERQAALAAEHSNLARRSWADDHFRDLADWAFEASMTLSEAIHHCTEVQDSAARKTISAKLSCYIDTGRWYFPNTHHNLYGDHKEPAYRGYRQPVLDSLVEAYNILNSSDCSDRRDELVRCQRRFVSEVQVTLNPRSRQQMIEQTLKEFEAVSVAKSEKKTN